MTARRLTVQTLAAPGLVHGFFGREGGVSTGLYESLNCGPGSRDDADAVRENRRRVAAELGPGLELVTQYQIHSATVHRVPHAGGRDGDGMVTVTPGLALGILTADCAPVLLADPRARVIGAAHAGWKGALAGVLENTVAVMETMGAARARIRAAIGPAITQTNYEVGAEMRDRIVERDPRDRRFFVPSDREGRYRFDLKGYAARRLAEAGVTAVEMVPDCTYPPQNGFFSFRRATHAGEPDYGRQVSAIALTG